MQGQTTKQMKSKNHLDANLIGSVYEHEAKEADVGGDQAVVEPS